MAKVTPLNCVNCDWLTSIGQWAMGNGQWAWGMGHWMFFEKVTGLFVGRGGIRRVTVNGQQEVELGYALMPEYWGRELAVEIGEKALFIAFDQFHYPSVVGYTLVENQSSQRVMQKLGFAFEDNLVKAGKPHVLYRYQNPECDRQQQNQSLKTLENAAKRRIIKRG